MFTERFGPRNIIMLQNQSENEAIGGTKSPFKAVRIKLQVTVKLDYEITFL